MDDLLSLPENAQRPPIWKFVGRNGSYNIFEAKAASAYMDGLERKIRTLEAECAEWAGTVGRLAATSGGAEASREKMLESLQEPGLLLAIEIVDGLSSNCTDAALDPFEDPKIVPNLLYEAQIASDIAAFLRQSLGDMKVLPASDPLVLDELPQKRPRLVKGDC